MLNSEGLAEIECNIVCDEELSGSENIETFVSLWDEDRHPRKRLALLGYRVSHPNVQLESEQDESLLLLPDMIARLVHSAHLPNPGRLPLPLPASLSADILRPLVESRHLLIEVSDYSTSYDDVFGHVMEAAHGRSDG